MRKNYLRIFSLLFMVLIITGCGCSKKSEPKDPIKQEEKNNENVNAPVVNYKDFKGLKIGTASFSVNGEKTFVKVSIKNDSNQSITVNNFKILLKDSDGKVVEELTENLGTLKPSETKEINDSVDKKLLNIATIDYE